MPDTRHHAPPPRDWNDAFAALPQETPPAGSWDAIATRLDARRKRSRTPLWLATAAAVLLAVALPWRLQWFQPDDGAPRAWPDASPVAANDPLETLYAESARLETLLAVARDDRMASGTAAYLVGELDVRLATIDAALMQPDLANEDRVSLWQERVDSLRTLAGFESNQRWLASDGLQYQASLVRID